MNERFTYLVVKFLEHELEGDEMHEFEKYLSDPECKEYLRKAEIAHRIIKEGFKGILSDAEKYINLNSEPDEIPVEIIADVKNYKGRDEDRFREVLNITHQEMLFKRRIRVLKYGTAAAAILIGIFFIFLRPEQPTSRELFSSHMNPYYFETFRSKRDSQTVYDKAKAEYSYGDYEKSLQLCKEILTTESMNPDMLFLYGLNLMEMDSMENAIRQFETIIAMPLEAESSLYVPVHWYAGLCYLWLDRLDLALMELEKVKVIDNWYKQFIEAEELYRKVKRMKKWRWLWERGEVRGEKRGFAEEENNP